MLVRRSGQPALSSSDVCVSRIESIKCLFGKDVVAKYGLSAPVIHGTLYFGIRGGEHIRILCRRTMRHWPHVRPLSRSRFWNPAGGGVIGGVPGYSPVIPLPARHKGCGHISNSVNCRAGHYFTSVVVCQPSPPSSCACPIWTPVVDESLGARPLAPTVVSANRTMP